MLFRTVLASMVFTTVLAVSGASAAPRTPAPKAPDVTGFLHQLGEAQKWLGEQTWEIKDGVAQVRAQLASEQDQRKAIEVEVKALREEVKGLYVENASLKEHIESAKAEVLKVNDNVSSFRTFSGFFLAIVLLASVGTWVLSARR